jgi:hypothetical protein
MPVDASSFSQAAKNGAPTQARRSGLPHKTTYVPPSAQRRAVSPLSAPVECGASAKHEGRSPWGMPDGSAADAGGARSAQEPAGGSEVNSLKAVRRSSMFAGCRRLGVINNAEGRRFSLFFSSFLCARTSTATKQASKPSWARTCPADNVGSIRANAESKKALLLCELEAHDKPHEYTEDVHVDVHVDVDVDAWTWTWTWTCNSILRTNSWMPPWLTFFER